MRDVHLTIAVNKIARSATIMTDVFAMSHTDDEASIALLEQRIKAINLALNILDKELKRVKMDQLGII